MYIKCKVKTFLIWYKSKMYLNMYKWTTVQ